MFRRTFLVAVLVALCVTANGQVQISPPPGPVPPMVPISLLINGLPPGAQPDISWEPQAGAFVIPTTWAGKTSVWVMGSKPGKYTIKVTLNAWVADIQRAAAVATTAGIPEAAQLATIAESVAKSHPFANEACEVTIAGTVKPPPDDPVDPQKPSGKPLKATYIYEKDDGPIPPPVAAALNKLNADKKTEATSFEDDQRDGSKEVPPSLAKSYDAAKKSGLPCLVIEWDNGTTTVTKSPTTEAQIFQAVGGSK